MSGREAFLRAYCAAVDRREDPEGIAARYWIADGVLDNTAIGNPPVTGRVALAAAYRAMFAAMGRLEHTLSDVREGADGTLEAAVHAAGQPVGGDPFAMQGRYRAEFADEAGAPKLARLTFHPDA